MHWPEHGFVAKLQLVLQLAKRLVLFSQVGGQTRQGDLLKQRLSTLTKAKQTVTDDSHTHTFHGLPRVAMKHALKPGVREKIPELEDVNCCV